MNRKGWIRNCKGLKEMNKWINVKELIRMNKLVERKGWIAAWIN